MKIKYDKIYNIHKAHNVGDIVWACGYQHASNKESKKYFAKPVRGMLTTTNYEMDEENKPIYMDKTYCGKIRYFVPFKKNGKGLAWSQAVSYSARCYADSEEECIELYNELIDDAIAVHQQIIASLQNDKI